MGRPNRTLLIGAIAMVALILGVTAWKARHRTGSVQPAEAPVAEMTDASTSPGASGVVDAPLADVWAGRAPPPVPKRQVDGKPSLLFGGPEERERAKREYEQLARNLEEAHRKEPVDAAWKGAAETSMRSISEGEALKSTGFGPAEFRSDCRSRSCRISATFDNTADAQDWATMFTTMTGSDFRSARYVTVPTADGRTEIRIYGNRR